MRFDSVFSKTSLADFRICKKDVKERSIEYRSSACSLGGRLVQNKTRLCTN